MKLSSVIVLTLSLAFEIFGASSSLRAQEASVPSSSEVEQCVKWMKATVPGLRTLDDADLRRLDPAHFCSGIQEGGLGGWGAVFQCGQPAEQLSGTAPRYCASSGEIDAGHAWAAGFSSSNEVRQRPSRQKFGRSERPATRGYVLQHKFSVGGKPQIACGDVQAYSFQVSGGVEACRCEAGWRIERCQAFAAISGKRRDEERSVRLPSRDKPGDIAWPRG